MLDVLLLTELLELRAPGERLKFGLLELYRLVADKCVHEIGCGKAGCMLHTAFPSISVPRYKLVCTLHTYNTGRASATRNSPRSQTSQYHVRTTLQLLYYLIPSQRIPQTSRSESLRYHSGTIHPRIPEPTPPPHNTRFTPRPALA
jgi:hypothetical protein